MFKKQERKKLGEIHKVTNKTDWDAVFGAIFVAVIALILIAA